MRVAVVSCYAYRDAWKPFAGLFNKFWPDCPYDVETITDILKGWIPPTRKAWSAGQDSSWCDVVSKYAALNNDNLLLMQEDLFLTAPVRQDLIEHALEQMKARNAGMVRLYPCPGADEDYGDPHFGIVKKGSRYRISCQTSVWRPDYLRAIASRFKTPAEFEIHGTEFSETLPDEVLAFKRDSGPWPMEYLCSAISRGLWSQDAKRLCDEHGISADWSLRGFQAV